MTRTCFALAAVTTGLLATSAHAHNGFGIAPVYSDPFGIIVVDGATPLFIRWTSSESHPDQFYRFRAQLGDFPPTPSPPSKWRDGDVMITLPADQLSYDLPLDVSELPHGAWRIYADFDEPPFCVELEQVPALVVVRDEGAPPPFGVLVTEPIVDSPIVDRSAPISIEAIAPSAPKITIEAGEIIQDPDFPDLTLCIEFTWTKLFTVATDLPMVPDDDNGPDRYRLDWDWNTVDVPDGAYLMRITATDDDGVEHVHWARRWINVEHEIPITPADPGPEVSPEQPPETTEAAEVAEAETPKGDSSCQSGSWSLLSLLLLARRRPAAQTAASSATR